MRARIYKILSRLTIPAPSVMLQYWNYAFFSFFSGTFFPMTRFYGIFLNPPHFAHKTRPRRFAGRAELCRVPGQPVNDRVVPQVDQPCIARKPPHISAGLRHSTYRRGTEVSLLLRSITLQPLERSVMCNTPFSSGSDNSGSFPVVPVQNGIGTGILNGRTKKHAVWSWLTATNCNDGYTS